jgi:hypothetical protein
MIFYNYALLFYPSEILFLTSDHQKILFDFLFDNEIHWIDIFSYPLPRSHYEEILIIKNEVVLGNYKIIKNEKTLFPIDNTMFLNTEERSRLNVSVKEIKSVLARPTGEKRIPRKNEWFINLHTKTAQKADYSQKSQYIAVLLKHKI